MNNRAHPDWHVLELPTGRGPRTFRTGRAAGPFPTSPVTDVDSQAQPSIQEPVLAAVHVARSAGLPWEAIGEILDMDPQTARGRYA